MLFYTAGQWAPDNMLRQGDLVFMLQSCWILDYYYICLHSESENLTSWDFFFLFLQLQYRYYVVALCLS